LLPANVPHAALSLSPHYLYGQTFHVKGRAKDPTTLELELSARAKLPEAIRTVLNCYKEGLQDPHRETTEPAGDHVYISSAKCKAHAARKKLYS
jgi:hypothetical protein